MRAFLAIVARDLRLAGRGGGDLLTEVLFFVMIGVIVPFAVGPDRVLLARLTPGMVWIAALLALLLSFDRLFRADWEDGSLTLLRFAAPPLEAVVAAKMLAHWLGSALPLLIATPVLALLLSGDGPTLLAAELSLLAGTPGLVGLGAIGAAVTVSLGRGGLLGPVLLVPLAIPLVIFGVGAIGGGEARGGALLLLSATSLVLVALAPFAAAAALRAGED